MAKDRAVVRAKPATEIMPKSGAVVALACQKPAPMVQEAYLPVPLRCYLKSNAEYREKSFRRAE
jgi:hypothetical protein